MEPGSIQNAIQAGEKYLMHHCVEEFGKLLERKDPEEKLRFKLGLLFSGQAYLLNRKPIICGTVYDFLARFFEKYPSVIGEPANVVKVDEFSEKVDESEDENYPNEYGEIGIINGNHADGEEEQYVEIIYPGLDDPHKAEIQLEGFSINLPVITGSIATFILKHQLKIPHFEGVNQIYPKLLNFIQKSEFDLSADDAEFQASLDAISQEISVSNSIDPLSIAKVRDLNRIGFQLWQLADLHRINQHDEVSVALKSIIKRTSELISSEYVVNVSNWALASLLYSIGSLSKHEEYEPFIRFVAEELKIRKSSINQWEWRGVGKIFNTCLTINAFNQLNQDPPFIQSARNWLAGQIRYIPGEGYGYWQQDLFDVKDDEWDVWATVLALKALNVMNSQCVLENPDSHGRSTNKEKVATRKIKGFRNKWNVIFMTDDIVKIDDVEISLNDAPFLVFLGLVYQLIVHPESGGWIKSTTDKKPKQKNKISALKACSRHLIKVQ